MEKDKTLAEVLEGIEDFRQENSIEHKLIDILIIAILATICGASRYVDIYKYAQAKIDAEKQYYASNEYSEVSEVKAAGQDAFSYTVLDKQMEVTSRYVFIVKGEDVYIFQSTIATEYQNQFSDDVDAMYESWALK